MREGISSNAAAKLQQLQDLYSQFFQVSIIVIEKQYLDNFTILSNGNKFCYDKLASAKSICQSFFQSMLALATDRLMISPCPFGCRIGIAPLGRSLETGNYRSINYYLVIVQPKRLNPPKNLEPIEVSGNLFGGEYQNQGQEFAGQAKIILEAFDLVFALLEEAQIFKPIPEKKALEKEDYDKLTKREKELLRLVSIGMSNLQIAQNLYISESTVKAHISNIMKKLNSSNRTQLAIYNIQSL